MFARILVGMDGSILTSNVVSVARTLAQGCDTALHVFCAVDQGYFLDEPDGERPTLTDEIDYPAAAFEREHADALVRQIAAQLRGAGLEADGSVADGEPVSAILHAAAVHHCDAILIGHRHLSWLRKATDRSVCHVLLERASMPVIVVPPVASRA